MKRIRRNSLASQIVEWDHPLECLFVQAPVDVTPFRQTNTYTTYRVGIIFSGSDNSQQFRFSFQDKNGNVQTTGWSLLVDLTNRLDIADNGIDMDTIYYKYIENDIYLEFRNTAGAVYMNGSFLTYPSTFAPSAALQSVCTSFLSGPQDIAVSMIVPSYNANRPAGYNANIGLGTVGSSIPQFNGSLAAFSVNITQLFFTTYPNAAWVLETYRQNSTTPLTLVKSQSVSQGGTFEIFPSYLLSSLVSNNYIFKFRVYNSGVEVTSPFSNINITTYLGLALHGARISHVIGRSHPLQTIQGSVAGATMTFTSVYDASDDIIPTDDSSQTEYVELSILITYTPFDNLAKGITIMYNTEGQFGSFPMAINQPIVDQRRIFLKTGGVQQSDTKFKLSWARNLVETNFPFYYNVFDQNADMTAYPSEEYTSGKMNTSLSPLVDLAILSPGQWVTNSNYQTSITKTRRANPSVLSVQLCARYGQQPTPPPPEYPLQGWKEVNQQEAIAEGQADVENMGRNLNSIQDQIKFADEFQKMYHTPQDIESKELLKEDLRKWLIANPSYRAASVLEVLTEVNTNQNAKSKVTYPHLTDADKQMLLLEYYPKADSILDVYQPSDPSIRRPYYEALRDHEKAYDRKNPTFLDGLGQFVNNWIMNIYSPSINAQYDIATTTDWKDVKIPSKNFYYYGAAYNVHNETQGKMLDSIVKYKIKDLYDPVKDTYQPPPGFGVKLWDYITNRPGDTTANTILALNLATMSNNRRGASGPFDLVSVGKAIRSGVPMANLVDGVLDVGTTFVKSEAQNYLVSALKSVLNPEQMQKLINSGLAWRMELPSHQQYVPKPKKGKNNQALPSSKQQALPPSTENSILNDTLANNGTINGTTATTQVIPYTYQDPDDNITSAIYNKAQVDIPYREQVVRSSQQLLYALSNNMSNPLDVFTYPEPADNQEYIEGPNFQMYNDDYVDLGAITARQPFSAANFWDMYVNEMSYQFEDIYSNQLVPLLQTTYDAAKFTGPKLYSAAEFSAPYVIQGLSLTAQLLDEGTDKLADFNRYLSKKQGYLASQMSVPLVEGTASALKFGADLAKEQISKVDANAFNIAWEAVKLFLNDAYDLGVSTYNVARKYGASAYDAVRTHVSSNWDEPDPQILRDRENMAKHNARNFILNKQETVVAARKFNEINDVKKALGIFDVVMNIRPRLLDKPRYDFTPVKQALDIANIVADVYNAPPKRKPKVVNSRPRTVLNSYSRPKTAREFLLQKINPPVQPPPAPVQPPPAPVQPSFNSLMGTSRFNFQEAYKEGQKLVQQVGDLANNVLDVFKMPLKQKSILGKRPAQSKPRTFSEFVTPENVAIGTGILLSAYTLKKVADAVIVTTMTEEAPADVNAILDDNITQSSAGRMLSLHAVSKMFKNAQTRLLLNPSLERLMLKAMGQKWAMQAVKQKFAKNLHGYIHYKSLKALADPEDWEEQNLNKAIQQYFAEPHVFDSKNAIQLVNKSRVFDNFKQIMDQSYQLSDYIEGISHKNHQTHSVAFNGSQYAVDRPRPVFNLPEAKQLRALQQPQYVKKRNQKFSRK